MSDTKNDPEQPGDASDADPVTLQEPEAGSGAETQRASPERRAAWIRLLHMIVFAILFGIAETVLGIAALLQIIWILVTGRRNEPIATFGADLSRWLADVVRFQTAVTEDKPFPWRAWK